MNQLDPVLKRLLKQACETTPTKSEAAPFGFASRVLANREPARAPTLLESLQQTPWSVIGISLAVIVCGSLLLVSHSAASSSTTEISSVMNFMASKLTQ